MNTYDNLNKRCETVIRCLPDAPFRHTIVGIYAELFSEIDRLNRKILQEKTSDWEPISTAPTNGEYILGCNKEMYFPQLICFASYHPNAEGKFCWRTAKIGGIKITGITHWMKLPAPPNV